ncbi:MAG: hypothetical protein KAI66_24995, partial [Lentisphaeria bacterium]|nr:hypothetical protein [Lentisphaeria bacterium]
DHEGNAVHNELTYLFVQSIVHTRMAYPGIGLCVHDETPDDLLDLAVDMLSRGYSHPAIFNDEAITRGLLELGIPERDACNYVHSSCVEITLCAQSSCWVFSPNINTPQLFLDVMREVSEMMTRACEGIVTLFGSKAVPGMYSYLRHVTEGEKTPATPDGRRAHTPLAAASSPVQGRDVSGPTASILSSTCWNQLPFMGGVAINLKFQPQGAATRKSMKAVIKTSMARGGLQLQVNCVSREDLLDARANPDKHRDLLVRIGGYSDYFTSLSPGMQDEIVNRTEQDISDTK